MTPRAARRPAPRRRPRAGAPRRRGRARCRATSPPRGASCCAAASCCSSSHCSQRWKSTSAACRSRKVGHGGARGVLQLVGHVGPRQPVLLDERAPGGEVGEAVALAVAEVDERLLAAGRSRPTSKTSRRASFLAVHAASRSIRSTSLSARALGGERSHPAVGRVVEPGQLGHVLDPQVEGVHEAPGGRQVRRGLHRRDRLGGVQRVDQHEVGVVRGRGPGRQVGEVAEVADAPRLGRAHLVQLRHQADDATLGHGRRAARGAAGVTTRVASTVRGRPPARRGGPRAGASPAGRSPGTSKVASPTGRPSTSRSGTHRSTCGTSRTVPSSSTTSSRMPVPAGTWAWHPRRPPLTGDHGRRAACGATGRARRRRAPARPRRRPRPRRRAR